MKLSNQAMGALMMTLQKCLLEETDIVPLLREMDFIVDGPSQSELVVLNPPVVNLDGVQVNNVSEFTDQVLAEDESEAE
tara:strand:- start:3092 stop:3328 length:237 start_codon:yes stop_codon:yes gene_type:complete